MKKVQYFLMNSKELRTYYLMDAKDEQKILHKAIGCTIEDVEVANDGIDTQYVMITLDNGLKILITPACTDHNGTDISDEASLNISYDGIGNSFNSHEEILEKLGPDFLPEEAFTPS